MMGVDKETYHGGSTVTVVYRAYGCMSRFVHHGWSETTSNAEDVSRVNGSFPGHRSAFALERITIVPRKVAIKNVNEV